MLDGSFTTMQRSKGAAALRFERRKGRIALADLAQSGSARAMMPRTASDRPEVVFLNTSGGLTSGDHLSYGLTLGDHTALTATTQTAERAYMARDGAAHVQVRATVGAGGRLDWLPQETILFEDCNLSRETVIDLAPDATCLLCEIITLGRRAMGEVPKRARLRDARSVTVAGRPLWAETVVLDAQTLSDTAHPALLQGHAAFAVLALVGPGAETAATALRALPQTPGVSTACSGWDRRTLLRLTAPDVWPLKQALGRAIVHLTGQPLPRVWQMQGILP